MSKRRESIQSYLPDDLIRKVKVRAIERYGGKKGDLSRAVEEAMNMWLEATSTGEGYAEYFYNGQKWTPWNLAILAMRAKDGNEDASRLYNEILVHGERKTR